MAVYATEDQLTDWIGETPDTDADLERLLREASRRVGRACRNDLYTTQANGLPEDDDLTDALRDATCAQVEAWIAADVNPIAGAAGVAPTKTVKTVDGVTIQYDSASATASTAARSAAVDGLCSAALDILWDAGLASGLV